MTMLRNYSLDEDDSAIIKKVLENTKFYYLGILANNNNSDVEKQEAQKEIKRITKALERMQYYKDINESRTG